ncbi:MAG: hypothetical protein EBS05_20150 [Proteobacteria bacterium]|jgi:hypothetical protein|nr:hypothetical protein [Pseudomonadota bacterium]
MSEYLDGGPQKTRETFWLHFACGFVVGAGIAYRVFGTRELIVTGEGLLLAIFVCATVTGLLAGHHLDGFWRVLTDWFRWW